VEGGLLSAGTAHSRSRTRRRFLTRIAVISDTHLPRGARTLPGECVRLLAGAELVLHGGDFVSVEFLEELREIGPPVEGVVGNMDEPRLKEMLPKERVVEVGGMRIGMVHDAGPRAGREARLAARFEDCEAVVYGHTHIPQVERHKGVWILNPGSPTERRRARARAFIVLDVRRGEIVPTLVELT
jgi:uncharacterized protein